MVVYVRGSGTVVREFNHLTHGQCLMARRVGGEVLFVKTAGTSAPPLPDSPIPYFDHAGRVRLLRNAVDVAASCEHPALPSLLNVIESPDGPVLVYEAADGDTIGVSAEHRSDPATPYQRLAHMPAPALFNLFDTLIDVHAALASAGWVACDLYYGCLIFDFQVPQLSVIDLDSYRKGPSVNDMGRMFGSTRFMAPEELQLGAVIDERTTVFTLGRIIWHFATRLTEDPSEFCGAADLASVIRKAFSPSPGERHSTVAELAAAWNTARGT